MIYLKLSCTAFLWGGTFIAGRMIAPSVHPVCASFWRFFIASLFLAVLLVRVEGRMPALSGTRLVWVTLLGMTGVFAYNIFFFTGLQSIPASRASLIIANNPIFISLLSALFFKEQLNGLKAIGIIISVTGAVVVITNGQLGNITGAAIGIGDAYIFGCVASWVSYSLIGKRAMRHLTPLAAVAYSSMAGTLLLFPVAMQNGLMDQFAAYGLRDWGSLFYLGFFGTVLGFLWYYQGISKIGPMKASVFINFVPISALMLAALILDETITLSLAVGALLVVTGVYITNATEAVRRVLGRIKS